MRFSLHQSTIKTGLRPWVFILCMCMGLALAGCAPAETPTGSPTPPRVATATLAPQEGPPTFTPDPPAPARTPDTAEHTPDIPHGIYAMMDWARIAGAEEGKAAPWVQAGHYAFTWRQINPEPGVFDWSLVDMWLTAEAGTQDAPTGKRAALGVNAYEGGEGDAAPQWILDQFGMRGYAASHTALIASAENQNPETRPMLSVTVRTSGEEAPRTYTFQSGVQDYWDCADTWIEAAHADLNHAMDAQLAVGGAGQSNALLGFHLEGLPEGGEIISATLSLYVEGMSDPAAGPLPVEVYPLRRTWTSAQAAWLSPAAGETWTIRGANGVLANADRDETPIGAGDMAGPGWVHISLEPAEVARWWRSPAENFGILVKQARDGAWLPRYWEEGYQRALSEMLRALADRYASDRRVAWVEISVGIYGETAPANDAPAKWAYAEAGLTSDMEDPARGIYSWVNVVRRTIDMYREAFPNTPLFLQYSNNFESVSERAQYVPYAVEQGIGLKHNGLYPDSIDGATYGGPAVGTFNIMFTYSETVPAGWEFQVFPYTEGNVYWALLNALDKHADFVMVQKDAVSLPELVPIYEFANLYLGATLETTPGAWVALRETRRPAERWYTQMGNFSFWLSQRDIPPDGMTLPLWDVTASKEGLFTRRTDQAGGNRYMYFDVDDRYLEGYKDPLTVEIVYLDTGRDAWRIEYDAGGGKTSFTAPIAKTDSGQWKKEHFILLDAQFANGIRGFDFRLDCMDDGDETVHWVQVSRMED